MAFFKRVTYILTVVFVALTSFPIQTVSDRAEDFRLLSYVVGSGFLNENQIDSSHFKDLTDVVLFGVSSFNTEGEVVLDSNFEKILGNLKNAMKDSKARLHLNLIGPGFQTTSTDWNEQMVDLGNYHNIAFKSGKLEKSIKDVLAKYDFDGVFFDYEYPIVKEHWKAFDKFLISLDSYLGKDFKIGAAISSWNANQSRKAMKALDMVEVMAYDMWDKDGTHSSIESAKKTINQMLLKGYRREQLDFGIPFFGRPVTKEAYWHAYNGYCNSVDENGFCLDERTGLTFSFNTCDVVYEKTQWAIIRGLGGAMVWHYSCDVPNDNNLSLFNAMYKAKTDLIKK